MLKIKLLFSAWFFENTTRTEVISYVSFDAQLFHKNWSKFIGFFFLVFWLLDFYISPPKIPSCFAFSSQEIPKQTYYTCAVQSSLLLLDNTLSSCSPGDTRWSLYPLSPTCLWSLLQICRKLYMTAINFLQTLKSPSFPTGFYVTFHFLRPVVHILSGGFLPGESGGNLYRGSIPVLGIIVNAARQKSQ